MADKIAYIIQTPRLGLRNWMEDDLNAFTLMNRDKDVMRFFPQLLSKEQSWEMIERQQELFASKGYCFFAADILDSREFIGFIGLSEARFKADFTPCVEIGWRLRRKFWNRGLATEGARACLQFAKDSDITHEIYALTPVINTPSERVMQKIGMSFVRTFVHPAVSHSATLAEHVLYRINI